MKSVFTPGVPILSVEAGATLGWRPYIGPRIGVIGLERFGASAPGSVVSTNLASILTISANRRCRCWRKESDTVLSIGIAADHGGFYLKEELGAVLRAEGYKVKDFGANGFDKDDDYPDFVTPLAKAVASGEFDRGIAVCGSGVGASIAANKVSGVRAALVHDVFSAHQGVEDDNMNILCLGGRVIGNALAADLVHAFLGARFSGAERHLRRLSAIDKLERKH